MNFKSVLFLVLCITLSTNSAFAQVKNEREHRIRKSQFPEQALTLVKEKLANARRIRFYKEIDSSKISYEAKFKKDRLQYSVKFNAKGKLEDVEIIIKPVDIPNDAYSKITTYLEENFIKYKIRKIQQQYITDGDNVDQTLKEAFQNLMLPSIKYVFLINGKNDNGSEKFEILFNSEGKFELMKNALPPNYDHVLY
ncbi:hypothetical protein [Zobellia barbeyronii]|uniref:Uncharacterized protein n=1 Tax=Zobellia barbeyronii TaxID=2748009 RepID=A0ABS5WHB8_9FLAO|nr:hypothetical protein [Zobellia barbeyronii]MBT2162713.1 hypothetical protein [Zobellia barbeyronii]